MCIKFSSPGMTGVPDRVVILPGGRIAFIEVKKEGGRLSERQKLVLRQFYDIGVQAEVVWNKEDVDDILERMIDVT